MADSSPGGHNVFLSWSKDRSRSVATALYEWLPSVIQRCRPWMSAKDIFNGQRWRNEIAQQLSTIRIGVVCVTPENRKEPWLNFEAGALSRTVADEKRVCCYCFGISPAKVEDPLGEFNGSEADAVGTWELVRSINAALEPPTVGEPALRAVFEAMWPALDRQLKVVPPPAANSPPPRDSEAMVEEILIRVRRLERHSGMEARRFASLSRGLVLDQLRKEAAGLRPPPPAAAELNAFEVDDAKVEESLQKLRSLDASEE